MVSGPLVVFGGSQFDSHAHEIVQGRNALGGEFLDGVDSALDAGRVGASAAGERAALRIASGTSCGRTGGVLTIQRH